MGDVSHLPPHAHVLDGKLHDDCDHCDEIRRLWPLVHRQHRAETQAAAHVGGPT